MASNKFATLIHRRTNRFTLILVYAFLEWILIFLILLNSLFSYFILKLADYFGLKRPCLFCSRLDRIFDGSNTSYKDLLCDDHAKEISNSKPLESKGRFSSDDLADFGDLDYSQNWNLIGDDVQIHNGRLFTEESRSIFLGSLNLIDSKEQEDTEKKLEEEEEDEEFSCFVSSFDFDCNKEEEEVKVDLVIKSEAFVEIEDEKNEESLPKNLEFYIDNEDRHLIPVELYRQGEEIREISDINGDFILDFGAEPEFAAEDEIVASASPDETKPADDFGAEPEFAAVKDGLLSDDKISAFVSPDESKPAEDFGAKPEFAAEKHGLFFSDEISASTKPADDFSAEPEIAAEKDGLVSTVEISASASPDEAKPDDDLENDEEEDAEVSIGTEIPDHDQIGDFPIQKLIPDDDADDGHEVDTLEFKTSPIEIRRPILNLNQKHLLESSLDCPERVLTVEKLKSELEEERKALTALYEELEEERSASATAANETMAMINRLHEEKAAMQMEALQYQRMMEEQSEYDQEALQLLNELIVKREKENTELEMEMEVYRRRLEEYEVKEKLGVLSMRIRDSSVDSYRNNGDENTGDSNHKNTPADVVVRLDECLDDYEGERLSILERLKFLEEKITSLEDQDEVAAAEEEVKTIEKNGTSVNGNGHYHPKETNGKYRNIKSKRLLPLFNAVDGEMENGYGVEESENGEVVTVEEEVNELYERLEALEADREFLRHCVGSLKKGDKGINLLHEILQNLRDLRNIDLVHVRDNEVMSF